MGSTVGDMIHTVSDAGYNSDIPLIWSAYEAAERAHRGRRRNNGDRYISHPVEVATIVAGHGGTVPAICAALLHDVVEDAAVPVSLLQDEFGTEITALVEAVTAQVIRTSTAPNPQLMLVAVADRLHNLRTLRRGSAARRQQASLDTLELHVPLAHQLNMPAIAAELSALACATLDSLDRPGARERWDHIANAALRADPRWAADAVAALGGSAAIVGSGAVPEWALTAGGGGLLALATAMLFGRDPRAAKRLAEIIATWRRD